MRKTMYISYIKLLQRMGNRNDTQLSLALYNTSKDKFKAKLRNIIGLYIPPSRRNKKILLSYSAM